MASAPLRRGGSKWHRPACNRYDDVLTGMTPFWGQVQADVAPSGLQNVHMPSPDGQTCFISALVQVLGPITSSPCQGIVSICVWGFNFHYLNTIFLCRPYGFCSSTRLVSNVPFLLGPAQTSQYALSRHVCEILHYLF